MKCHPERSDGIRRLPLGIQSCETSQIVHHTLRTPHHRDVFSVRWIHSLGHSVAPPRQMVYSRSKIPNIPIRKLTRHSLDSLDAHWKVIRNRIVLFFQSPRFILLCHPRRSSFSLLPAVPQGKRQARQTDPLQAPRYLSTQPANESVPMGLNATFFSVGRRGIVPDISVDQETGFRFLTRTAPIYTTPPTSFADSKATFRSQPQPIPLGSVKSEAATLTVTGAGLRKPGDPPGFQQVDSVTTVNGYNGGVRN